MAVLETRMEGYTFVMTLNRPESMNAFNSELIAAVGDAWLQVREDSDIRSVVITGAGERAFSGGRRPEGDGPSATPPPAVRHRATPSGTRPPRSSTAASRCGSRSSPAVNGFALGGGCETAMACDIRVASETASFGLPEVARGIIPGAGGTQRIPRLVPFGIALELLMTGRRIPAAEAHRIGLVNHVVPPDQLMDKALEIAAEIGANAPLAVMAAKEAAYRGLNTRWPRVCASRTSSRRRSATPTTPRRARAPSPRSARPTTRAASALDVRLELPGPPAGAAPLLSGPDAAGGRDAVAYHAAGARRRGPRSQGECAREVLLLPPHALPPPARQLQRGTSQRLGRHPLGHCSTRGRPASSTTSTSTSSCSPRRWATTGCA